MVFDLLARYGKTVAKDLQEKAPQMTGTELNGDKAFIPSFVVAKEKKNMLTRPAGFVCKSSAGRVVRLLQPYDSDIYTAEPEELPAQWGFVWSDDPAHALPFVALATSPYMIGNVCAFDGQIYASTIDNNVHSPGDYPAGWAMVQADTK